MQESESRALVVASLIAASVAVKDWRGALLSNGEDLARKARRWRLCALCLQAVLLVLVLVVAAVGSPAFAGAIVIAGVAGFWLGWEIFRRDD